MGPREVDEILQLGIKDNGIVQDTTTCSIVCAFANSQSLFLSRVQGVKASGYGWTPHWSSDKSWKMQDGDVDKGVDLINTCVMNCLLCSMWSGQAFWQCSGPESVVIDDTYGGLSRLPEEIWRPEWAQ
jgi:hypothetical protein